MDRMISGFFIAEIANMMIDFSQGSQTSCQPIPFRATVGFI